MKRFAIRNPLCLLLAAAFALPLMGCGGGKAPGDGKNPDKITVAVTIAPEAAFVRAVCGDLVEIVSMVPPGASAETFEPSPAQMEELNRASIYFAIGVPVEEAYILSSIPEGTGVVPLQDEAAAVYAPRVFDAGEPDPHIWLSPGRAKVMVEAISREMAALDPANAEIYAENARAYRAELDALDEYIRAALADTAKKAFIVYHPAFGYFAEDYGLTMVALEEEGKEATAQRLEEVADFARENGIKFVFYQEEMSIRQAAAFAEEIGGEAVMLSPLSEDYINNLMAMADALAEALK